MKKLEVVVVHEVPPFDVQEFVKRVGTQPSFVMTKPWNKDRILAEIKSGYESPTQASVKRDGGVYKLKMVDDIYVDNLDRRFYHGASLDEIESKMKADNTLPFAMCEFGSSALRIARTEVAAEHARRRR